MCSSPTSISCCSSRPLRAGHVHVRATGSVCNHLPSARASCRLPDSPAELPQLFLFYGQHHRTAQGTKTCHWWGEPVANACGWGRVTSLRLHKPKLILVLGHKWGWFAPDPCMNENDLFPQSLVLLLKIMYRIKEKKREDICFLSCPLKIIDFFFSMTNKKTRSKPSVKMTQFGSSSNRTSCVQHHSLGCCWPTHSLPRHWLHSSYQFMDLNELLLLRNSWSCSSAVEPTSMWAPSYGCNVGSCCWLQGCSFCSLPKSLCFLLLLH